MKTTEWNDVLSVDVDEIDEDHHKLLDIYHVLKQTLADGDSPDYIEAILEELVNGTIWHFSHEERLMLKYGYAEMTEHRAAHRELIEAPGHSCRNSRKGVKRSVNRISNSSSTGSPVTSSPTTSAWARFSNR